MSESGMKRPLREILVVVETQMAPAVPDGGRALSLNASLILHCWKAESKRERNPKREETGRQNARWLLEWNEGDIYSLGGIMPLQ
jgi:hypothetical protein